MSNREDRYHTTSWDGRQVQRQQTSSGGSAPRPRRRCSCGFVNWTSDSRLRNTVAEKFLRHGVLMGNSLKFCGGIEQGIKLQQYGCTR